jgi:hypothetical protein
MLWRAARTKSNNYLFARCYQPAAMSNQVHPTDGPNDSDEKIFDKRCRAIRPTAADMGTGLGYHFGSSKLTPPSSSALAPQPISTMGQPNIDAVVNAGSKDFWMRQGGWKMDKSNPDDDVAREARLRKVFAAAYSSSDGGDPAGLTPEMQDICLPNDQVIASLNCVEVIGMPDCSVSRSEGFIQAAIIERDGNPNFRRLVIIASEGNASIKAQETMMQMFQKNCCGLCGTSEFGLKLFDYAVQVQESHELSMINVNNSVIHVGITKHKSKSYKASTSGSGTASGCCEDCCDCCKNCCDCICKCKCFECSCCESCAGQRFVSFKLSLSRQFGFTRAVKDESIKTSTGSSIASGDGEMFQERWVTSNDQSGIKKVGKTVDIEGQNVWQIQELSDDRLIITITYRSMVSKSLKQCQLVIKNCLDISGTSKTPTNSWAQVSRFMAELLPAEVDDRVGNEAPLSAFGGLVRGIVGGFGGSFGKK